MFDYSPFGTSSVTMRVLYPHINFHSGDLISFYETVPDNVVYANGLHSFGGVLKFIGMLSVCWWEKKLTK